MTSNVKKPKKKKKNSKNKPPTVVNLGRLKKFKNYLGAVSHVSDPSHQKEFYRRMGKAEFDTLCDCMEDFLKNETVLNNYFEENERNELKDYLNPWSNELNGLLDKSKTRVSRKKLLSHSNQKGGSAILAAVVGSLIPMAVQAIEKLVFSKKN